MKGLIKYELKKMISLWWLVYAAVMIFLFVVRTREETYNYFAYVLASIHIVKIAADTVRADEESGWLALQGILPVSKRQYLTVKYIRYGIVTALNCCFIYTLIGIRCALNGSFGILICGTGIGMSMAANKFKGIRAAVCGDTFSARFTRLHNDANILCMGARVIGPGLAKDIVDQFLTNDFEGGRHAIRVDMITAFENE